MRPTGILTVMTMAQKARELGRNYYPLFVGPPGIAKSVMVQKWCRDNGYMFIDLRAAYLEAPDLIGFPFCEVKEGRSTTVHALPEFWPHGDKKVVIFLDEVNRGTTSVLNTFMQLLTDRRVHNYVLPDNALIVGCINPEDEHHDVNTMDSAMKNRWIMYNITYDKRDHLDHMKSDNYEQVVIDFVETNTWKYLAPAEVASNDSAKYVSPRTITMLDTALKSGVDQLGLDIEKSTYESILGRNIGITFYNFKHNEQPVRYSELKDKRTRKKALEKLKGFAAEGEAYRAESIAITIRDIVEDGKIEDDLLYEVLMLVSCDQGPKLTTDLEFKRGLKGGELARHMTDKYPDYKKRMQLLSKAKAS